MTCSLRMLETLGFSWLNANGTYFVFPGSCNGIASIIGKLVSWGLGKMQGHPNTSRTHSWTNLNVGGDCTPS